MNTKLTVVKNNSIMVYPWQVTKRTFQRLTKIGPIVQNAGGEVETCISAKKGLEALDLAITRICWMPIQLTAFNFRIPKGNWHGRQLEWTHKASQKSRERSFSVGKFSRFFCRWSQTCFLPLYMFFSSISKIQQTSNKRLTYICTCQV